jgi:branched-chain amino acid transport system permease protein
MIFSLMLLFLILFYRRGLMGSSEFSWDAIRRWLGKLGGKKEEPRIQGEPG